MRETNPLETLPTPNLIRARLEKVEAERDALKYLLRVTQQVQRRLHGQTRSEVSTK